MMKTTHTPCQIVLLPVPVAGSPGWDRRQARPLHPSPAKTKRALWREQAIPPTPVIDKSLLDRMREAAKRHLAERRDVIRAVLAA
jgi:hypothetical protein